MGTGSENFLTIEAESALQKAQIIFGAKRILEIAENSLRRGLSEDRQAESGKNLPKSEPLYRAEEIFSYLKENPQYKKASVVFSGDVGFFSGAETFFSFLGRADKSSEKTKPEACDWEINVIPGISSAVYFASKLQKSWQNWKFLSLHGAKCNAIGQIRKNPGCFCAFWIRPFGDLSSGHCLFEILCACEDLVLVRVLLLLQGSLDDDRQADDIGRHGSPFL